MANIRENLENIQQRIEEAKNRAGRQHDQYSNYCSNKTSIC